MAPLVLASLIGAGVGVGKGYLDQGRAARQRQTEAEIARWSPWTGIQAQRPQEADILGSGLQGAFAGASFGQQFGGADKAASAANSAAPVGANPAVTQASPQLIQPVGTQMAGQPSFSDYWAQQQAQQSPYQSAWYGMGTRRV